MAQVDAVAIVNRNNIERIIKDLNADVALLTKRIAKAEHDRMSKYYRSVAELADWRIKVTPKIDDSFSMVDALSHHFSIENQKSSSTKS